ncbi:hypothetical protein V7x_42610 [Crateriforma conspicua]|uniref:Uncharacterized protein n=1 Tax=Crateriforma conspicua TaxID=2527996 RepID=A0A5C6FPW3_9PLAN|nr:hypothetical protein V7x_42610 [Crateriforma conspicua]
MRRIRDRKRPIQIPQYSKPGGGEGYDFRNFHTAILPLRHSCRLGRFTETASGGKLTTMDWLTASRIRRDPAPPGFGIVPRGTNVIGANTGLAMGESARNPYRCPRHDSVRRALGLHSWWDDNDSLLISQAPNRCLLMFRHGSTGPSLKQQLRTTCRASQSARVFLVVSDDIELKVTIRIDIGIALACRANRNPCFTSRKRRLRCHQTQ